MEIRVYDTDWYYLNSYVSDVVKGRKGTLKYLNKLIECIGNSNFQDALNVTHDRVTKEALCSTNVICVIEGAGGEFNGVDMQYFLHRYFEKVKDWRTVYAGVCKAIYQLSDEDVKEVQKFSAFVSRKLASFYMKANESYLDKVSRYELNDLMKYSFDDKSVPGDCSILDHYKGYMIITIEDYFRNWYNSCKVISKHDTSDLSISYISMENWWRFYRRVHLVKGDCGVCTIEDKVYYI